MHETFMYPDVAGITLDVMLIPLITYGTVRIFHSILLYFKLLPLAVLVLFTEAEALQSNSDSCLRCVVLVHKYSNCSLTLAFCINFTQALKFYPGTDLGVPGCRYATDLVVELLLSFH